MGVVNNTDKYIPKELIKNIYFSNIKNNDGKLVYWDGVKSYDYDKTRNAIIFEPCDKNQTNKAFIVVEFINNKILTTIHNREVEIID